MDLKKNPSETTSIFERNRLWSIAYTQKKFDRFLQKLTRSMYENKGNSKNTNYYLIKIPDLIVKIYIFLFEKSQWS